MKSFFSITIIVLLLALIGVNVWFLIYVNRTIQEHRKEIDSNFKSNIAKMNRNSFSFENDSIISYHLNKKELHEIKDHINYLSQEVDRACEYANNTLERDIDRLNTFMAFGVGFFALFGIFAPFMMNLLFKTEIQKDIEIYKNQSTQAISDSKEAKKIADKVKPIIEPANKIIDDFPAISKDFRSLEADFNKKVPNVSLLIMQNQIARLYNVSKIAISIRLNRNTFFVELFQNIHNSFSDYKPYLNNGFSEHFKNTIGDFHDNLKSNKIRYYIFEKKDQVLVDEFCDSLIALFQSKEESIEQKMDNVLKKLQNLIEVLKE